MSPPYTTASLPPVESDRFGYAPMGSFTQLCYTVSSSLRTAWAIFKPIYLVLVICVACCQIYSLYVIYSATRRANKATERLTECYSEYGPAREGLSELCRDLTGVIDSSRSDNEVTLGAIRRAMASGTSVPPPEVVELLKKLEETQEAASKCTARVGLAVCRIVRSLHEGTVRAIEEHLAADDRMSVVTSGCLRCRQKSSRAKDEEKGEGK